AGRVVGTSRPHGAGGPARRARRRAVPGGGPPGRVPGRSGQRAWLARKAVGGGGHRGGGAPRHRVRQRRRRAGDAPGRPSGGSRRYRVTYRGPGGHSWAAFGVASPATAVGRAAQRLAELPLPAEPRTTCAVVRLGGGTALNCIPQEAWLDLDLRSEDPGALSRLDAAVQTALTRARDEEDARRAPGTAPLTLDCRSVGDRPGGGTAVAHPLIQAAGA